MYYVTAQDMQERLILMVGGQADDDTRTNMRLAIRQALRIVSSEHAWPYYHDYLHVETNESYTTGTISYVASTRTVTLTGGTFPSWATQGVLIIDTFHARIESVTSSTVVVVRADDAPVDDYSGTFTLYQYQFTLNTDYNIYKIGKIQVDQSNWIEYVPPNLFETDIRRQWLTSGGRPRWFTISRNSASTGGSLLSLWPYPTTVLRLRAGYVRHPKDIRTWSESTGQVATAVSTAVTGTNTVFAQKHVGCLLRTYSDRINLPSSNDGRFEPVDEAVIKTVTSATALVTASALTTVASDVAYTISDILDIDNTIMMEVVAHAARREFASLSRVDPKLMQMYEMDYAQRLYLAKTQANSDNSIKVAGGFKRSNVGYPGLFDSYYQLA